MIGPRPIAAAEMQRANAAWGANCGPGALAAMIGVTLDEIRPFLGDFERKGYANPTLMFAALDEIGCRWRKIGPHFPTYGLARIQWEGPWTAPGVPLRARYRHTHWVGAWRRESLGVFDVNAVDNGTGWCAFDVWRERLVPWILRECEPHANGRWHVTHGVEIERPRAAAMATDGAQTAGAPA